MPGFMAGVFDALKTAEYNQSSAVQPEQEASHDDKFIRPGADDNSPYSQEPDEVKVSCPVRNWRWGGRPPRRPELFALRFE